MHRDPSLHYHTTHTLMRVRYVKTLNGSSGSSEAILKPSHTALLNSLYLLEHLVMFSKTLCPGEG